MVGFLVDCLGSLMAFYPRVVVFSIGSVALTGSFVFSADQNFKLFY